MQNTYTVGSKVRVKANPELLANGFKDTWAGVEGIIADDRVGATGTQSVKIIHDPHNLRAIGSVLRLVNLELIEGTVIPDRAVVHPSHYGGDTVYEVIKVIEAWGLGFVLGNVVKYVARAGKKSSDTELQDLEKARNYLDRRIAQLKEGKK